MCGLLCRISRQKLDDQKISKVFQSLKRRGPDGNGTKAINTENGVVELYHSRLAILAPGSQANQPISSNNWTLVFNGEIYNFAELASHYGISHNANSDTHVILHLLELIGFQETCKSLQGMFAICAYCHLDQKVYVARDRFGSKPLYYYEDMTQSLIASDISSITSIVNDEKVGTLTHKGAMHFLAFGYISIDHSNMYGINNIAPGSINYIAPSRKLIYINNVNNLNNKASEENWLSDVASSAVSDVPLAALISGGVDSAIVMAQLYKYKLISKTTLLTLKNKSGSNSIDVVSAQKISKKFRANKHIIFEYENIDQNRLVDEWLSSMQYPTEDGLNIWLASSILKEKNFKVCLTGVGGDELAGGYKLFRSYYWNILIFAAKEIINIFRYRRITGIFVKLRVLFKALSSFQPKNHFNILVLSRISPLFAWNTAFKKTLFSDYEALLYRSSLPISQSNINFLFALYCYCSPQLLRDIDYFGMSQSVEFRPSLLSEKWLLKLLRSKKQTYFRDKKKTLTQFLEKPIKDNLCTKKVGFTIDIHEYLYTQVNNIKSFQKSLNIDHPLSFVKYLEIDLLLNDNPRPEVLRFLLRIAILKKLYDKGIYTLEESENK